MGDFILFGKHALNKEMFDNIIKTKQFKEKMEEFKKEISMIEMDNNKPAMQKKIELEVAFSKLMQLEPVKYDLIGYTIEENDKLSFFEMAQNLEPDYEKFSKLTTPQKVKDELAKIIFEKDALEKLSDHYKDFLTRLGNDFKTGLMDGLNERQWLLINLFYYKRRYYNKYKINIREKRINRYNELFFVNEKSFGKKIESFINHYYFNHGFKIVVSKKIDNDFETIHYGNLQRSLIEASDSTSGSKRGDIVIVDSNYKIIANIQIKSFLMSSHSAFQIGEQVNTIINNFDAIIKNPDNIWKIYSTDVQRKLTDNQNDYEQAIINNLMNKVKAKKIPTDLWDILKKYEKDFST